MAEVCERKRHAALAGDKAVDLHHRNESDEYAVFDCGEIEWLVPVGFAQHLGPGGGVEEGGLVAGFEQGVPVGVSRGVDNLDVHK